jgi:hypothetical protein
MSLVLAVLVAFLPACKEEPILAPTVATPTATVPQAAVEPTDTAAPSVVPSSATATLASLPSDTPPAAPTDSPLPPTATLPPTETPTPEPTLSPTITITPTATATLTPTVPIWLVREPDCADELVRIAGISVQDRIVEITGTAAIDSFQYYKFEYQGGDEADWHFIGQGDAPVQQGSLYSWDASILPPGQYRLQLVVVDTTGNYPPPCVVEIMVSGEP